MIELSSIPNSIDFSKSTPPPCTENWNRASTITYVPSTPSTTEGSVTGIADIFTKRGSSAVKKAVKPAKSGAKRAWKAILLALLGGGIAVSAANSGRLPSVFQKFMSQFSITAPNAEMAVSRTASKVTTAIKKTADSACAQIKMPKDGTLGKIAKAFGVSADELGAKSGITDIHTVKAGQAIQLPNGYTVQKYTVQKGDSLFKIAKKMGLNVQQTKTFVRQTAAINGLDSKNTVVAGKELVIATKVQ